MLGLTLSMLDGSGSTPALETRWPRKVTEERARWHLDGLSFIPAVQNRWKT